MFQKGQRIIWLNCAFLSMIGFRSFVKQFMQIRYTVIPISFLDVQFNYFNSAKYLA